MYILNKGNWIPVWESLPVVPEGKYGLSVLVCVVDSCFCYDMGGQPEVYEVMYNPAEGFRDWMFPGTGEPYREEIFDPVTHWMYKPEPIKISKEEYEKHSKDYYKKTMTKEEWVAKVDKERGKVREQKR